MGHRVFTVSSDRTRNNRQPNVDLTLPHTGHWWSANSLYKPSSYFLFRRWLVENQVDLVHVHNFYYALSASVCFACKDIPLVVTVHDYSPICLRDKTLSDGSLCRQRCYLCSNGCRVEKNFHFRNLRRNLHLAALKRAKHVIAPSEYLQHQLSLEGIHKIRTLRHPCPPLGNEQEGERRADFLYLGRLHKQKGVDNAIKALFLARLSAQGINLRIAGEGPEADYLQALSKELQLSEHVEFLGQVDQQKRDQLLRSHLALIVPSLWPEVAGLVMYEAASQGCPSIGYNVGGIPEFIEHERTGLLVAPRQIGNLAEAMLKVNGDRSLANGLSGNARTVAREWDWDAYCRELITLYGSR